MDQRWTQTWVLIIIKFMAAFKLNRNLMNCNCNKVIIAALSLIYIQITFGARPSCYSYVTVRSLTASELPTPKLSDVIMS